MREQLNLLDKLNAEFTPFRILTGIEVDILDDGALDQEDGLLDRLDVVVASPNASTHRASCCDWPRRRVAGFPSTATTHAPGQLDWLHLGCARTEKCGIGPERVINTWGADQLIAWTCG